MSRFSCNRSRSPLQDIGRTTSGPEINQATGKVFITYLSSTKCAADPSRNYTSTIIFTCQRGLELVGAGPPLLLHSSERVFNLCFSSEQGTPQMLRLQGCVYLFEWATPIVCSDATSMSGCQLNDSQLQFSFDLSVLSGEVQVTIRVVYADIG